MSSIDAETQAPDQRRATPVSDRVAILVCGMHRSGTSALTRVVALLGADLPKNVMPGRKGNELGHWESEPIVALNDEVLASAGSSVFDVSPFPREWYASNAEREFRARMDKALAAEYADSTLFVLKDPRICRIVPFWLATLENAGVAPSFVLPVRNPLEVAASLAERDGLSFERGLLMWLRYTLDAERETRAHPRVFVTYEQLLADWESVARLIAERLQISWPRLGNPARAQVGRFLEGRHRHFEADQAELERHRAAVGWVKAAYAEISRAAATQETPDRELLDEIDGAAAEADRAYGPILAEVELREAEGVAWIEELTKERDALAAVQAESEARVEELTRRDDELSGRLREAEAEAARTRREHDSLNRELRDARSERDARAREAEQAVRAEREQFAARFLRARPGGRLRSLSQLGSWALRGKLAYIREWRRLRREGGFDAGFYLARYDDVLDKRQNPLMHYVEHGAGEGRAPNRASEESYDAPVTIRNASRGRSLITLAGWIARGRFRRIATFRALKRSGQFDYGYYLRRYEDVRRAGDNPLMHYIAHGAAEGRDPSAAFSTSRYVAAYPELAEGGANPLLDHVQSRRPAEPAGDEAAGPQYTSGSASTQVQHQLPPIVGRLADIATQLIATGGAPLILTGEGRTTVAGAGSFPADEHDAHPGSRGDTATIANLEALRAAGTTHLIVPSGSEAWLARQPRARFHLESRYPDEDGFDDARVYALDAAGGRSAAAALAKFVESYRWRFQGEPSILDCTGSEETARLASSAVVFEPPMPGEEEGLPYLDGSVDAVVVPARATPAELADARRVAARAVAVLGQDGDAPPAVEWLGEGHTRSLAISIVIPTYNGGRLLRGCLRSLAETIPAEARVEVVISDDASTDDTAAVVDEWSSRLTINHVRADRNAGFVDSCNRGAEAATGDVLVFLNNDTLALPGWLTPLITTLRDDGEIGVVGGKLVYGSGRLQEAGGVIFNDASGANFGHSAPDPDAPTYSFVRDVHYVSGALLATPAALFADLGGFDTEFRPGYYEDTDYCFRVRETDARVLYQPDCAIVHLEGGTAGTDIERGMKRHQVINKERFGKRWRAALAAHPEPVTRWDDVTRLRLARCGRIPVSR